MIPPQPSTEIRREIAIVVGGSQNVLAEWRAALDLCAMYSQPTVNFVCNSMIGDFPADIDNAVTLHPENLPDWLGARGTKGLNAPPAVWCHRPYNSVTNFTRDIQGSVGLFATKIARQQGYSKILAAGVPMLVEDLHYARKARWNACTAFQKAWLSHRHELNLAECFRSMSGWTRAHFGAPDGDWLQSSIDITPMRPRPFNLKA